MVIWCFVLLRPLPLSPKLMWAGSIFGRKWLLKSQVYREMVFKITSSTLPKIEAVKSHAGGNQGGIENYKLNWRGFRVFVRHFSLFVSFLIDKPLLLICYMFGKTKRQLTTYLSQNTSVYDEVLHCGIDEALGPSARFGSRGCLLIEGYKHRVMKVSSITYNCNQTQL